VCLPEDREKLSVSLNFRPYHLCPTASLRLHQILVLFGFRPSIVSVLRSTLLPKQPGAKAPKLSDLGVTLAQSKAAPCYLVLCDGDETMVIEKDLVEAKIRTARYFIVHTNHDTPSSGTASDNTLQKHQEKNLILGMEDFIEDSGERRKCVERKWDRVVRKHRDQKAETGAGVGDSSEVPTVKEETLIRWIRAYPTMNECTHFGCILDPGTGEIRWLGRGVRE
jgi:hypothetical protein